MKKLFILISLMLFLGVSLNAQKSNKTFTTDTVQGAETIYFSFGKAIDTYTGVLGFQFTKTDIADSCSVLTLQGSMDATNYVVLTGNAALSETTTDGTFFLYEETPIYLYYRLAATCAAGDTVKFTNVRFIYKED